jgi:hypothetical protein
VFVGRAIVIGTRQLVEEVGRVEALYSDLLEVKLQLPS